MSAAKRFLGLGCSSRRLTDVMGGLRVDTNGKRKVGIEMMARDSRVFWAETVGLKEESRENVGQRGGPAGFIVAVQSDSRLEERQHPRCQRVSPLRVPIDGRRKGLLCWPQECAGAPSSSMIGSLCRGLQGVLALTGPLPWLSDGPGGAGGQHSTAVLDSRRAPTKNFFSLIAAGRSVVVGEAMLHILLRCPLYCLVTERDGRTEQKREQWTGRDSS
ncbi:hypothetical protein J3F83DRAFT_92765 [Trichoderma novae-zelandiae]